MNGEKIQIIKATPEEREDNQFLDLPRIAFGLTGAIMAACAS